MSTGMSCSAENAAVDCSYTVAAAAMDAGASKPRITSRHRGLYFDSKHNAWRVRIFYLGRQVSLQPYIHHKVWHQPILRGMVQGGRVSDRPRHAALIVYMSTVTAFPVPAAARSQSK